MLEHRDGGARNSNEISLFPASSGTAYIPESKIAKWINYKYIAFRSDRKTEDVYFRTEQKACSSKPVGVVYTVRPLECAAARWKREMTESEKEKALNRDREKTVHL